MKRTTESTAMHVARSGRELQRQTVGERARADGLARQLAELRHALTAQQLEMESDAVLVQRWLWLWARLPLQASRGTSLQHTIVHLENQNHMNDSRIQLTRSQIRQLAEKDNLVARLSCSLKTLEQVGAARTAELRAARAENGRLKEQLDARAQAWAQL